MTPSIASAALACLLRVASGDPAATQPIPVLVELFTSEGCSSCPPADELLARLAREQPVRGTLVIALGEHVDYWDGLGWKDSFSSPLYTRRQEEYVRRFGLTGPYTPQLVIGGRLQVLGGDEPAARSAIAAAARSSTGSIALRVSPGPGGEPTLDVQAVWSGGEAELVLAVAEDRVTTRVSRGENGGRTLAHVAVVRSMVKLGKASGKLSGRVALDELHLLAPAHAVVFLQGSAGGQVYAANSVALPGRSQASAAPGP